MKILVTGASGFLGKPLTERLSRMGHEVTAVSRSPGPAQAATNTSIRWITRDIVREGLELPQITAADAIIHLAAAKELAPGQDEGALIEANELLTTRLLRALGGGSQKLIFASTQMVYGDPGNTAVTEDFPLAGMDSTPYACSKVNAENWLRCLRRKHNGPCVILRLCGFIEGGGNIDYIIDQALRNEPIVLLAEGKIRRDYLSLEAGVEAFVLAASYRTSAPFEVINVGSGQMMSAAELARGICLELGSHSEVVLTQQPAPRSDFVFNIEKARRQLGFEPGSLPEAVRRYARRRLNAFEAAEAHG